MKGKVVALLFIGLFAFAAIARAEELSEEADAEPAAPPKGGKKGKARAAPRAARKAAPAAPKGGAPYSADIPLEALSKLPVEPLAMDAAALKDDDSQFELFNANAKSMDSKNIQSLHRALSKATTLTSKMQRDLEAEKVWTKNVYDIIQNYQYKYLKTMEDVRMRQKKVAQMEKLVDRLKKSTLHAGVEQELAKASKALNELVARSPNKQNGVGAAYTRITRRMQKLKEALREVQRSRQLHSETTQGIKKILRNAVPPASSDALRNLLNGAPPAGLNRPKKAAARRLAQATRKAKAGKKPAAKPAAAKKAKGKGKAKAGAKPAVARKAAKKPAAKPRAAKAKAKKL